MECDEANEKKKQIDLSMPSLKDAKEGGQILSSVSKVAVCVTSLQIIHSLFTRNLTSTICTIPVL